ncbi:Huntingtin-interacting protein K [Halotydeus destructor]|nr:Huntingtin-interacting protein K [Halotydeus destructor]
MAGENNRINGVDSVDVDDSQKQLKKLAKHDSGAADLEKVTDFAEEQEISSEDIDRAMTMIGKKRSKEAADRLARQKELAKVAINKEDVELIIQELEISRTQAEKTLREHDGSVVEALIALTD